MKLQLKSFEAIKIDTILSLTGSKSETNRLLILQALWPEIRLDNLAECDDADVMIQALKNSDGPIDVGHAGTAMRFLTAYFAFLPRCSVVMTGSNRMKERPIGILVDALITLGADIEYLGQQGYPPLAIHGRACSGGKISMSGSVSSQYLTALMLVASRFEHGLTIEIEGGLTSLPYLQMTASMLNKLGATAEVSEKEINVQGPAVNSNQLWMIESDWSGASYWYSMLALSTQWRLGLRYFSSKSLQGDRAIADLFQALGVHTEFDEKEQCIWLSKLNQTLPKSISWNLIDTPDLAQTIAVCCFGLGIGCHLTGLHTLKIKETDRLSALSIELTKLGALVDITENSLRLSPREHPINPEVYIDTYRDHRMAMAFAPLVVKVPIGIVNPDVVTKSYPNFWNHMTEVGVTMVSGN
ncbi:3-phosphoshikimate 1-carboxyvinyltransferase [Flavobacteriaceae bacterium]|nr:3-phosphoshikimate 1-carboxyvinyltransferase [Flavobacteriaceae bacterium]